MLEGGSGEERVGNGSSSDDGVEQQEKKPKTRTGHHSTHPKCNSFNNSKPDDDRPRKRPSERSI